MSEESLKVRIYILYETNNCLIINAQLLGKCLTSLCPFCFPDFIKFLKITFISFVQLKDG